MSGPPLKGPYDLAKGPDPAPPKPCQYCGSVNGESPPGAWATDPMTGDNLRASIAAACPLTNPRLSEVDWDAVAAVFAPSLTGSGERGAR